MKTTKRVDTMYALIDRDCDGNQFIYESHDRRDRARERRVIINRGRKPDDRVSVVEYVRKSSIPNPPRAATRKAPRK